MSIGRTAALHTSKMAVLQTALALLASGLLSEKVEAQNVSYPSYQNLPRTFDYVIVGGGPGGLTLANRLTEDPAVSVAVVEAGTFYQNIIGNQSTVPGYDFHYDGKSPNATIPFVDWGFVTTPQAVSSEDCSSRVQPGGTDMLSGC